MIVCLIETKEIGHFECHYCGREYENIEGEQKEFFGADECPADDCPSRWECIGIPHPDYA